MKEKFVTRMQGKQTRRGMCILAGSTERYNKIFLGYKPRQMVN
jgi:hypothetical protein